MAEEKLKVEIKEEFSIQIFENSSIFLNKAIEKFNIEKLVLNIFGLDYTDNSEFFNIKYAFSYDRISWSNKVKRDDWDYQNAESIEMNKLPVYICIYFEKIETDLANNEFAEKLYEEKTERNDEFLMLFDIHYDEKLIDIQQEEEIRFETHVEVLNKFPKWNFYKNQNPTIERWLRQCESIAQMYGHVVVYFKTEPTETNDTLQNHTERDVVSIKKQLIISPNNEIPQDRNVYERDNDWSLEGDFMVHIVDSLFKGAFGEDKIPLTKDYLYFPMINKLFRINSANPKLGIMGTIGMWEIYLVKYEDDETINMSDNIKDIYSVYGEEIEDSITLLDQINEFNSDTKYTKEKIDTATIEEKKETTQNFSNRIVDSTSYIDVKETDAQREFYAKRLDIVSINPSTSSFPVTMYDCSGVEKRNIGLTYNISDLTSINKFSNIVEELSITYDFVLIERFVGEVIDFIGVRENPLVTIQIDRKRYKKIVFSNMQYELLLDYEFVLSEYYKIEINFISTTNQISVKIYMLENGRKVLKYQDLKFMSSNFNNKMELKKMYLYGGKYYIGKIHVKINNEKIITDECNPVLLINNKGRN